MMNSKLQTSTIILSLLAVMEHIALLYIAGAEILIEHYYPSDTPLFPEIPWAIVGTVMVSLVTAGLTYKQIKDDFIHRFNNPVDVALRWTFAIMLMAMPPGILLAAPTFFLAAPLTVILPYKLGGYLAMR